MRAFGMRVFGAHAGVGSRLAADCTYARRAGAVISPRVEPLEGRRLLSFLQPFGNKFDRVRAGGVLDLITVSGPGQVFTQRSWSGRVTIVLAGTTQDSQVTVSSLGARPGKANSPLAVGKIRVQTGRLGSFQGLTTVDLDGPISSLTGPVASLQLDSLGPAAQITVTGNLGQLIINRGISLGQRGWVNITNDLTGSLSVAGDVVLSGGKFIIGRDLSGSIAIGGSLALTAGARFAVGRNLGATATGAATDTITGNLTVDNDSVLSVGGNLGALTVDGNVEASGNGAISIGGDLTTLTVSGGGSVAGNVTLGAGGLLDVDGNLGTLSLGGDLRTSGGGQLEVGGDLGVLSVTGVIQGRGSDDIAVGDDLGQLTVLGGGNNTFGLSDVGIEVDKNLQGLDVRNGISDSLITAGILINGGTPGTGSNGWNIGPDGANAVFDSQILAGTEIENLTVGGDVASDLPSNPAGRPTRIVAGEYPLGTYSAGATIDNVQIAGNLVDAVLAASVEPYNGFYPQPAGTIPIGFVPTPPTPTTVLPIDTAPPFADPSIPTNRVVLPGGSINPSFAPQPLSPTATPGTAYPLPSKSTVLGQVITDPHLDAADYAGIFAANTAGVIVGGLPPTAPQSTSG